MYSSHCKLKLNSPMKFHALGGKVTHTWVLSIHVLYLSKKFQKYFIIFVSNCEQKYSIFCHVSRQTNSMLQNKLGTMSNTVLNKQGCYPLDSCPNICYNVYMSYNSQITYTHMYV